MSGDVQPRKRKDKKRRKDDSNEQLSTPQHIPASLLNPPSDDVNIHVHKEGGTGGNICAKIVFFFLFSALIVLIGLIITEHRGLTDVDTVDTESRFSQLFEGWVDNSQDDHDDNHDHIEKAIEDHEEDDEHDEDDEHEEEDEENITEEDEDHDEEDEEEDHQEESEEVQETQEDDDVEETQEDDDDEDEEDAIEQSEEQQDEDETNDISDEIDNDQDDEDENDDDEEENVSKNLESEEQKDNEDDDDEDNEIKQSEEQNEDDDADKDDSGEKEEKGDEDSDEKEGDAVEDKEEDKPEEEQNETSGSNMIVKIGVGVALLVVAHVVLIRKWKSDPGSTTRHDEIKEPTPDLSRRNTIVPPPTLQEVEQDIENDEEDYSDEEGEYSEEDSPNEPKSAKAKYQELRSTYSRSLTPESDAEYEKKTSRNAYEDDEEEYEDESVEEEQEDEGEGEEEELSDDGEDYNEDEDEELLKRLEAKYGKLDQQKTGEDEDNLSSWERVNQAESDSDNQSEDGYEHRDITNKEDWKIKDKIDEGHQSIENNAAYAIKTFDAILEKYPNSPRSLYGKALALDQLADTRRSNEILQTAISTYLQLLNTPNIPDKLFEIAADRCINRMRFIGQYRKAISVHFSLIDRFPENVTYPNQLAVTYLTINRVEEARQLLKKTLSKWPNDGFTLVHYGFILKTTDNNLKESVKYLEKGINTKEKGTIDGRFYFHLGDALSRLGQNNKAMLVYEDGVKNKVFLSKYQRSLYNVDRLTGRPWWEKNQTPYDKIYRDLEGNWERIRDEGLAVLNEKGYFQDEAENLRDTGDWKQFELFARGQKNVANCKKCPFTCKIIENNPMAKTCKRGQTKFSVMHPGTHVWPHCGPTNCRLRVHLGLKVPPKTFIRVAEETRSWEEGKVFIFDDSFEHEVWQNSTEFRLVLIVDVWHPELTQSEIRSLSPI